jgi:hypothetical protein
MILPEKKEIHIFPLSNVRCKKTPEARRSHDVSYSFLFNTLICTPLKRHSDSEPLSKRPPARPDFSILEADSSAGLRLTVRHRSRRGCSGFVRKPTLNSLRGRTIIICYWLTSIRCHAWQPRSARQHHRSCRTPMASPPDSCSRPPFGRHPNTSAACRRSAVRH